MNAQFILMSAANHRAHGFIRGFGHGIKSFILFFWHAIPIYHFYSAYRWGIFLGVYLIPIVLILGGGRRYSVTRRVP